MVHAVFTDASRSAALGMTVRVRGLPKALKSRAALRAVNVKTRAHIAQNTK